MDSNERHELLAPAVSGFTSSGVGPKVDLHGAVERLKQRRRETTCGASDAEGPDGATCARPEGHDAAVEGHSAILGVHEDGEQDWHHWPER